MGLAARTERWASPLATSIPDKIVTTFAGVAPGDSPDPAAAALTAAAEAEVAPLVSQVVGFSPVTSTQPRT